MKTTTMDVSFGKKKTAMDFPDDDDQKNHEHKDPPDNCSDDIQAEEKLKQFVSIRSEESITEAASSHIEQVLRRFKNTDENNSVDHRQTTTIEKIPSDAQKLELDRRVRIGEITPFQAVEASSASTETTSKRNFNQNFGLSGLENYLKSQAELAQQRKALKCLKAPGASKEETKKLPKNNKLLPNDEAKQSVEKKGKTDALLDCEETRVEIIETAGISEELAKKPVAGRKRSCSEAVGDDSGSEYVPSDGEIEESDSEFGSKKPNRTKKKRRKKDSEQQREDSNSNQRRIFDDGDDLMYQDRMEARLQGNSSKDTLFTVENLFKVPKIIWKKLYEYQRVSVRWLWELHGRGLGGLLGDEMGLGKTVQVIAFLAGLDVSELLSDGGRFRGLGPTIVVCPATLLEQWVKHFQEWAPLLRVVVLHYSGTYRGEPECLIESVLKTGGIIVTSYSGVLRHKELLLESRWHYVILDEGHKIRNPEAKISRAVKKFSTPHRLLLTGSPMQNSLKELWSLFDFILPGKLGTQSTFLEHCANPITRGGYSNASPLQEATALQVATMLKDAIAPYMLRRTKNDVQHHIQLPEKNEQVLFCSLTELQKNLYKDYLRTDHVSSVLHDRSNTSENSYRARLLVALTNLRKICNHPDIYSYGNDDAADSNEDINDETAENFGHWKRSGKLAVVRSLLKIWKRQGHRVLLFTQGRQMMHVLEALAQREGHTYLRLDGTTPMSQRQQTIHKFNNNPAYFVFISTTRVGGLGVNLTGANRVVIYDPDWNPAIDAQARERAWRIGQDKRVTIYRLITAGTVEEKIYHRQIFKLLLSNRVLEDPRQRRLFQTSDLAELFNLNEPLDGKTSESDRIFHDCKLEPIKPKSKRSNKSSEGKFSASKIEAMRKLASTVSKRIRDITTRKNVDVEDETSSTRLPAPAVIETIVANDVQRIVKKSVRTKHRKERKSVEAKCSALFEGEKVPCLIGRRIGRTEQTDEERLSSTCDDQYVLSKLFSKTNVSSAFQHDAVLSNARSDGGQINPMNRMARDAAQESMDLLRQSRKWCWRPTWDSTRNDE